MAPFRNSDLSKLFIGGCGVQLGLLLTFLGLSLTLFICVMLTVTGALTFSVAHSLAQLPTGTPVALTQNPALSPLSPLSEVSEEADRLLAEIDILISDLDSLRTEAQAGQGGASTTGARAVAPQAAAILYNGPGPGYDETGILEPGHALEIVGRDATAAWWLVAMPTGRFGWVADADVSVQGVDDSLPVAVAPAELAQPAASSLLPATGAAPASPTPAPTPTPTLPPGTPTPGADIERRFVEETASYASITGSLLVPPVSASYSPDGRLIALTEGVKLYTFKADGSVPQVWLEDAAELRPVGGAVWSPDGQYIAAVVEFKPPRCFLCRGVAILNPDAGEITFLDGTDDFQTDAPRWTQDGRLLVNAHPGEPADGTTYVYNIFGEGQEAAGVYTLSSSHDGQKWFPWLPGRVWRAGVTERPDSYYGD